MSAKMRWLGRLTGSVESVKAQAEFGCTRTFVFYDMRAAESFRNHRMLCLRRLSSRAFSSVGLTASKLGVSEHNQLVTPDGTPYQLAPGGARLLHMDWAPLRVFREEEDPDRTSMPAALPSFLTSKAPSSQPIEVEHVNLPYMKESYFAVVVNNIFTREECQQLIDATNAKGYTPALLNIGGGRQQLRIGVRDGWRCIMDSSEFADYLLEALRPALPPVWGEEQLRLSDLNERLRFLYYLPGQVFEPHFDGKYRRPRGHAKFGDVSKITVQLYLNDSPKENGGATTFLQSHIRVPCQPRAGSALLFSQNLFHEGSLVTKGYKYTVRTEVMYGPPRPGDAN